MAAKVLLYVNYDPEECEESTKLCLGGDWDYGPRPLEDIISIIKGYLESQGAENRVSLCVLKKRNTGIDNIIKAFAKGNIGIAHEATWREDEIIRLGQQARMRDDICIKFAEKTLGNATSKAVLYGFMPQVDSFGSKEGPKPSIPEPDPFWSPVPPTEPKIESTKDDTQGSDEQDLSPKGEAVKNPNEGGKGRGIGDVIQGIPVFSDKKEGK